MVGAYQNITTFFILQTALGVILDKVGVEINAHATCIIIDGNSHHNEVHLHHLPTVRSDCQTWDKNAFINQMQHGVAIGCSFFVVYEGCILQFLDNFRQIHDWVDQKYEKKVLVVIDTQSVKTYSNVMDILRHRTVINDIPLTLLLQANDRNEWINVWSSYPYGSYHQSYNRFFLSNFSFEYDKEIIPKLTDLNGLMVTGAFINYPPYTSYQHVSPGTGNANLFNSNESVPIYLDGQENIILVEFCLRYNCTLTARLEYDVEQWGETYDNQTGTGLLGALTIREADVSVAALYLWEAPYKFSQYTPVIQKATATFIVPKPLPLPYWQTPILPFPGYIWSCVISSFLLGGLILFVVNVCQRRLNNRAVGGLGLFDAMYAVFKMSIFQGVPIDISCISNITIFTAILTFALIIGNLYCGGLSSVMTITRFEKPIDSIETLTKSKVVWGSTTFAFMEAIERSEYPPHKKLIKNYIIKSIPELYPLVQQHKFAVTIEVLQHGTLSYQSYLDIESAKNYMLMKKPIYSQFTVVMSSKTWPFMEQLNRIVFMQQESGIRYYWEYLSATRTMDYDIQRKLEENGQPPQAGEAVKLSVEHILGALFVLLFGSTFSTIMFLLEILLHYFSSRRLQYRKSAVEVNILMSK